MATSNTIAIYRHGRKYYIPAEEYEQIISDERQLRRTVVLKSQQIPVSKFQQTTLSKSSQTPVIKSQLTSTLKSPLTSVRSPSTNSYNPIQRTTSNPYDYKYGVVKTHHIPVNSSIDISSQRETNRLSHSTLKHYEDRDDLSTITATIPTKKSLINIRSHSSDKILDNQCTVSLSKTDEDVKRSLSAENAKAQSPVPRQKQRQIPTLRPIPTIVSDYGVSPMTTISLGSADQTISQTHSSKLTNYFSRMKQSNLNPPSKSNPLSNSETSSFFETSMPGFDQVYTALGSANPHTGVVSSSSLFPSITDNSKIAFSLPDTTSAAFSDNHSSSLSMMFQRRNMNQNYNRQGEYVDERDNIHSQQRDSWTRSTMRSQLSDGTAEKKRVRFADMEGFTLETVSDNNKLRSTKANRLLARRQHTNVLSDSRNKQKPTCNRCYQLTTEVGKSKLATDV